MARIKGHPVHELLPQSVLNLRTSTIFCLAHIFWASSWLLELGPVVVGEEGREVWLLEPSGALQEGLLHQLVNFSARH